MGERNVRLTDLNIRAGLTAILPHFLCLWSAYYATEVGSSLPLIKLL